LDASGCMSRISMSVDVTSMSATSSMSTWAVARRRRRPSVAGASWHCGF
jgi:hypothetical protein